MTSVMIVRGQFAVNRRQAAQLVDGLTAAEVHRPPGEGSWSVAQCLEHVALTHHAFVAAMRRPTDVLQSRAIAGDGRIAPNLINRAFLWLLEPPVRWLRVVAPVRVQPPDLDGMAPDVVLARFNTAQDAVIRMLDIGDALDLNAVAFPNPFGLPFQFTLGSAFLVMAAHERRHLWQAENMRRVVVAGRELVTTGRCAQAAAPDLVVENRGCTAQGDGHL